MNSLLARQLRKLLDDDLKNDPRLSLFLKAIERSYENYEDQFSMLQRAMSISSEELFDANTKLKDEAKQQQKVIASLQEATKVLERISVKNRVGEKEQSLTGIELAKLIEKQAKQISEIEEQRQKILEDLEKSNQQLSEYAHVVSHDLKSPLRTINTLMNWIKEDNVTGLSIDTQHNFNLIDQNIQKMDHLINDILEYSLIDKKPTRNVSINVEQLMNEIIDVSTIPKHIKITIGALPNIYMDKVRLRQVFQNLIENAITSIDKPKGTIHIEAKEHLTTWEFIVGDNGKGIAEKYHEKIFEVFQSLEVKGTSTGIGLSIVKKIIEFYKGKVWVTSQVGVGTTFHFTIKK